MRSENASWLRRMPWKLIGFGAAFIGGLFAWHFTRDAPSALADGRFLAAHTTMDAAEPAAEAEPVVAYEAPAPARRAAAREEEDPELDITVVVEGEDTVIEESTYVETAPAQEPQHVVIVVHPSSAPTPVRKPHPVRGRSYLGHVPNQGGFTPRNPRVPSGPLTPRTNRSPRPPRGHATPPRRRSPVVARTGSGSSTKRRRSPIRRR